MGQYFPKTCSVYRVIKVELDLPDYATKSDVKRQQVLMHPHLQKSSFG